MTRPRPVLRGLAAGAVLTLALGGLTACGDDSSSAGGAGSSDASTPSSSSSSAAPSEPADASSASASVAAGETVPTAEFTALLQKSVSDLTTAHVALKAGGAAALSMQGDIDYTGKTPALAMKLDLSGQEIEARLVDGTSYLKATEDRWVSYDAKDPKNPFGSFSDQLDLTSVYSSFGKGLQKVVFVGNEDGLDHYQLTLDTSEVLKSMGQDLPAEAAGRCPRPSTTTCTSTARTGPPRSTSTSPGQTLSTTYSKWGEPVDIQAPPPPTRSRPARAEVSGRACCRADPSCWSAPGPWAAARWSGWRPAP